MDNQIRDLKDECYNFLLHSQNKPQSSAYFPQVIYMEQSIKQTFKLINKKYKVSVREQFINFWKELNIQQQIKYYCAYVYFIQKAAKGQLPQAPPSKQQELMIRRSMVSGWEKMVVKVCEGIFTRQSGKKLKQYPLKTYEIRKSKNKEYFGWVLQPIDRDNNGSLHCGVRDIKSYEDWYECITKHIQFVRVKEFSTIISDNIKNGVSFPAMNTLTTCNNSIIKAGMVSQISQKISKNQQIQEQVIQNPIQNNVAYPKQGIQQLKGLEQAKQQVQQFKYPNILNKLIPGYNITNFLEIPFSATIVDSNANYQLYEIPNNNPPKFKITFILPFHKFFVFQAITEQAKLWNTDIDSLSIQTSITTQNSALMLEKHKSQGLFYSQRDFLFLRHCFSITASAIKQVEHYHQDIYYNNTFIVDKSMESEQIITKTVRGQKELIWCLLEGKRQQQCIMVMQGWMKWGGYLSASQNKQLTIRYFKMLLNLQPYLKQKLFDNPNIEAGYFKQHWYVCQNEKENHNSDNNWNEKQQGQEKGTNIINQIKQKQYYQFVEKAEQKQENNSETKDVIDGQYHAPSLAADGSVIIPKEYLTQKYYIQPSSKSNMPKYFNSEKGHHIFKGQWEINNQSGGLIYIDEQIMKRQRKVFFHLIKSIGKNIISGKNILNVSLPVDIFCKESNIQMMSKSMGYFPLYLEKAAAINDQEQQLKYVIAANIGFALVYITMQKPFNPILGQTYQSWIDGCPVYAEQISHHPPIAALLMKGRGYQIYGSLEAKMDISLNSGVGVNEGIMTVQFDNGNKFYYTGVFGQLSGLNYGTRMLNFLGKVYYWSNKGLFMEVIYNPAAKTKGFFFGNSKYVGEEALSDYFEGTLKRYQAQELSNFLKPKKGDTRSVMLIPKSPPPFKPIKQLYKVHGRCFQELFIGDQKFFNVNETRYYDNIDEKYPLPSNCNYRQDIVYRRLCDIPHAQQWKQILQIRQREDEKLRTNYKKNK